MIKNKGFCWLLTLGSFLLFAGSAKAEVDTTQVSRNYREAYGYLCKMLQYQNTDFEQAVYLVENAYYGDSLSFEWFHNETKRLAFLAKAYRKTNPVLYNLPDSLQVATYASIFKVLTDSIPIAFGDTIVYHQRYTYNFDDFDGSAVWSDMFVADLLKTHKGNCHSLPYLYKIIAQELGTDAYLALAPNHTYIKLHDLKDGWFNTELTSGDFPLDAWVMASGYVHLNAIQNAVYMDTVGDMKCLAMCLVDLAEGYEKKAPAGWQTDSFMVQCCAVALQYFPNYINALLLQSKIYDRQFTNALAASEAKTPQAFIDSSPTAKALFDKMTAQTQTLHDLGYRRMPTKMYLEWLAVLKTQREKYSNKKIITFMQ